MIAMKATLIANVLLCVIGCVIASQLGNRARGSWARLVKSLGVASILSWTAIFSGGHGGAGVLPTIIVLCFVISRTQYPINILDETGAVTESFAMLFSMSTFFLLIALTFLLSSKTQKALNLD